MSKSVKTKIKFRDGNIGASYDLWERSRASEQPVPRCGIFLLEGRNGLFGSVWFNRDISSDKLTHGSGAFLYVNLPVAATFEDAAERDDSREYSVPVPPPGELTDFGPRIRVKDEMTGGTDAGSVH